MQVLRKNENKLNTDSERNEQKIEMQILRKTLNTDS